MGKFTANFSIQKQDLTFCMQLYFQVKVLSTTSLRGTKQSLNYASQTGRCSWNDISTDDYVPL